MILQVELEKLAIARAEAATQGRGDFGALTRPAVLERVLESTDQRAAGILLAF